MSWAAPARPQDGDGHDRLFDDWPESGHLAVIDKWKPAEEHAEDQDREDAGEKRRNAETEKGECRRGLVEQRVLLERREDADGDGDENAQHECRARDHQRGRQTGQNVVAHGDLCRIRLQPIALDIRGCPPQVLDVDWVVQTHGLADSLSQFGRDIRVIGKPGQGITRRERQDGVDDDADGDKREDRDDRPAYEVASQPATSLSALACSGPAAVIGIGRRGIGRPRRRSRPEDSADGTARNAERQAMMLASN